MREDNRGKITRVIVIVALLGLLVIGNSAMKGCFGTEVMPENSEATESELGAGEAMPGAEETMPGAEEVEKPEAVAEAAADGNDAEQSEPGEPDTGIGDSDPGADPAAEEVLQKTVEEAAEVPAIAAAGIAEAVTELAGSEITGEKDSGEVQGPKKQESNVRETEKTAVNKTEGAAKPENSSRTAGTNEVPEKAVLLPDKKPAKKSLTGKTTESSGVLKNTVRYSGLEEGEEYVITGTLMDQETGEEILVDGQPIKASRFFTAIEDKGSVKMKFPVSYDELKGKSAVVFQKVYDSNGDVVLEINDLNAEGQSVTIPREKFNGSIRAEELHRRNKMGEGAASSYGNSVKDSGSGAKAGLKTTIKKVLFLVLMFAGVLLLAGALKPVSDVEKEGDDVSVLNHILLAFRT